MKVSVCIVAYNAEKYIKDALDSVFNQDVNFNYEILINDDASTDKTVEIIEEYQTKYPNIIRLFKHKTNQYQSGNYKLYEDNLFVNAIGEYIAMLDADDFWTDTNKLQDTVDYLERNKNFSMVLHKINFYNDSTKIYSDVLKNPKNEKLSISEIIGIGSLVFPPCSMVFRNVVKEYPNFMNCLTLDRSVVYLLMLYGEIGYIAKPMSAYRQHDNSFIGKNNFNNKLNVMKSNIFLLNGFNEYSNYKYDYEIKKELSKMAKLIMYFGTKDEKNEVKEHLNFFDTVKILIFNIFRKYKYIK